ncbi:hypothetical protein V6D40_03105 [Corynebacterium sp. Q4381]
MPEEDRALAAAQLDDGSMWPTSYAVLSLDDDTSNHIRALIRRAAPAQH